MKPGLNAIMGATGSGKSSFLDVLAARKDPAGLSGEVLIDGAQQPPNFKCLSGYVVQDDVVMGTLTVRENLTFSAALRLPASVSQEEKEQKVEKLIQELGLGRVADSRVGTQLIRGVSGGERKRTSIGMELIIDPPVLFLDEPTTGLDASTANSVLLLLKRVHLAAALNNSDVSSSSMQGIEDKLVQEYRKCSQYRETRAELERIMEGKKSSSSSSRSRTITYKTGFFTQFRWVLKRTFQNLVLNPQTSFAQIAVSLFLALIVGVIFFGVKNDATGLQNRTGALYFIAVNQCFNSQSSAALFIAERKLFIHEYISGYYRVSVYFLCKMLSDFITLRTIPAILYGCVSYFMIGLKPTVTAFFIFVFSITMVTYTATAMVLAISADQTVVAIANIFITITFIVMMIFAGVLVNLPSIPSWLAWLKYFSIPRYGFAALQINEFTGEEFLDYQGVDWSTWGLWQNYVALGVMTFCFLTIAYLKLRFIRKFT
ncbi:hypothetical protein JOQ06_029209 [Pogonophryne albipinna]|uniref:ABC transporter domain-containing protein n=1 Tax=Pogonophryne albipinna TaxID=1090488 RepID=A0AAD6BBL6_9TELE|nr:hypothetical protein JOQ06_029209 [Pogonophryne albipinna]